MSTTQVLLPSYLGSKFLEEELKQTQTVTQHLLKMILTEDRFVQFHKGQNEAVEDPNDHPAGLIASFVAEKLPGQQNVVGFELKSSTQDTPASPVETSQASKRSLGSNHQNVRCKCAKGNMGGPEVQEEEDWNDKGGNGDAQQPAPSHKNNGNTQDGNRAIEVDESEESQEEMS
ncbi:hypothetical protein FRC11_002075, partial [Ceratobasidium sp. 423]